MTKRQKQHRAILAEARNLGVKLDSIESISDGSIGQLAEMLAEKKAELSKKKKAATSPVTEDQEKGEDVND